MKDGIIRKTKDLCARTLEELSVECIVFGVKVREQLNRFIIAKGGPWGAVAFSFLDSGEIPKLMLASFKSDGNLFRRYSYFIIRNKEEAKAICNIIFNCFEIKENEIGQINKGC